MKELNLNDKIEYLTNQNKFYRTKLAQAAVKIQELKRELKKENYTSSNQIISTSLRNLC